MTQYSTDERGEPDDGRLAALNAGERWDFSYEKQPKCPHCGTVGDMGANDWWELYEEGEHAVDCPSCDRQFTVSTHVSHSFSTDEQPEFQP